MKNGNGEKSDDIFADVRIITRHVARDESAFLSVLRPGGCLSVVHAGKYTCMCARLLAFTAQLEKVQRFMYKDSFKSRQWLQWTTGEPKSWSLHFQLRATCFVGCKSLFSSQIGLK
jgi:hypothetical protein